MMMARNITMYMVLMIMVKMNLYVESHTKIAEIALCGLCVRSERGKTMSKSEMIKWLQNLKEDIGQTQHQDLWHYEEMLDKVISTIEVSEDCISRLRDYQIEWLTAHCDIELEPKLEQLIIRFLNDTTEMFSKDNAPSVVSTVRKNRTTAEPQTYITEDRDTQILDAWQVHHRNITTVEDEPTTEQSSKVGEWIEVDDGRVSCKCSICKEEYLLYEEDVFGRNYCPNCGAKMKGADNDRFNQVWFDIIDGEPQERSE